MQTFNLLQKIGLGTTRLRGLGNYFNPKGRYDVEHRRSGLLIAKYPIFNDITNEGKNLIFNVMFNGTSPITTWYIGLIDNSGFSALNATDVMNSHSGWTEFTHYTQTNRVTWVSGASTSQQITNGSPSVFNLNASGTVYGLFITSNNTISGTTGKLWSTGSFTAPVPVVNGDQFNITYTLNA